MDLRTIPLELQHSDPRPYLGRVWVWRAAGLLLLALLAGRLWLLQVVRAQRYESLASLNRVRREPTFAPRGGIYDRQGQLLAGSRLSHRVVLFDLASDALPGRPVGRSEAPGVDEQLARLTDLLDLGEEERAAVATAFADPERPRFTPVTVLSDLDPIRRTRLEEHRWELPNVVIEEVPRRSYPTGADAAHVSGYVGSISPRQLDARRGRQDEQIAALAREVERARRTYTDEQMDQLSALTERLAVLKRLRQLMEATVGKSGLEAEYETTLQGEPGIRTWQVNARNQPTKLLKTTSGAAGHALHLNLDLRLQVAARRALGGRPGSCVAIDPRDGGILALVSSPSYDPNLFVPSIGAEDWRALIGDRRRPLHDRAASSVYPPGSTFKLVTASAGLAAGAIGPHTGASCGGGMNVGGRFKKCWAVHGWTDLTRAIAVSCDVFFYQASLRMGPDPLRDLALRYGLGQKSGIDLPNEVAGRIPDPAEHQQRYHRRWSGGDTTNFAIGQGDVQCSTLQMARVVAAVANGGQVYRPQLVREIRSRDGRQVLRPWQPELVGEVGLPTEQIERVRAGLRAAVTNGTARIVDLPGIAVAGKTGSAEDPPRQLPHAWFVCFAPYDAPTIAIACMVENSGHGSTNAGPIARAVLAAWFGQPAAAGGEEPAP